MFIVQGLSQLKRLPHLLDYRHCILLLKDFLTTLLLFHLSLALALSPLLSLYLFLPILFSAKWDLFNFGTLGKGAKRFSVISASRVLPQNFSLNGGTDACTAKQSWSRCDPSHHHFLASQLSS